MLHQDTDRAYGQYRDDCLRALVRPGTVRDVAARLGWSPERAKSWVHWCHRAGLVTRVGWTTTPAGQRAGRYQRVMAAEVA